MPSTLINDNPELFQALDNWRRESPQGNVFLMARFNDDNSRVVGFQSVSYFDHNSAITQDRLFFWPVELQAVRARGPRNNRSHYIQATPRQGGGHAEEYFIRFLLTEYAYAFHGGNLTHLLPQKVELYVSRIPCPRSSAAWLFSSPEGGGAMFFPEGCGPKLYEVMRRTTNIRWTLTYDEVFPHQDTTAEALAWLNRMNSLAHVQAGPRLQMLPGP